MKHQEVCEPFKDEAQTALFKDEAQTTLFKDPVHTAQ